MLGTGDSDCDAVRPESTYRLSNTDIYYILITGLNRRVCRNNSICRLTRVSGSRFHHGVLARVEEMALNSSSSSSCSSSSSSMQCSVSSRPDLYKINGVVNFVVCGTHGFINLVHASRKAKAKARRKALLRARASTMLVKGKEATSTIPNSNGVKVGGTINISSSSSSSSHSSVVADGGDGEVAVLFQHIGRQKTVLRIWQPRTST